MALQELPEPGTTERAPPMEGIEHELISHLNAL